MATSASSDHAAEVAPLPRGDHPAIERARRVVLGKLFGEAVEPERLGRYELVRWLGSGGMGTVYLARDPELGRSVAVKVLSRSPLPGKPQVERLLREARVAARLNHPNVVSVYDVGLEGHTAYVVMEYVEGGTLEDWTIAPGRGWREIVAGYLEAARGLAAAHAMGLLHRDFKPANVLVDRAGRIRVADFGLAVALDCGTSLRAGTTGDQRTDTSSNHAGTIAFMAPEQHLGLPVDERSDVYAFCVALYRGLYREYPFSGSLSDLLSSKLAGNVALPRTSPMVGQVHPVLVRGLQPDPRRRWASMQALADALDRATRPARWPWFVGITALFGLASAWPDADGGPLCDPSDAWAPVWAEESRQSLLDNLAAQDVDVSRAAASIDAYAARWNTAYAAVCMSSSRDAFDRQMTCLARARAGVATLLALAPTERAVAHRLPAMLGGLPDPTTCTRESAVPRARREVTSEVAQVGVEIGEMRALEVAGRYDDALQRAVRTLARAREAGDPWVLTQAGEQVARLLDVRGRSQEAASLADEVLWMAMGAGADEEAFDVALELAWIEGISLSDRAAGERYLREAEAMLERRGPAPRSRALLANARASVAAAHWDLDEARMHADAAVEFGRQSEDPELLHELEYNLGAILTKLGRHAEAVALMEPLVVWREAHHGPESATAAVAAQGLAEALLRAGDPNRAQALAERSVVSLERVFQGDVPDLAEAHAMLGEIAAARADYGAALEAYRRAFEIGTSSWGAQHPFTANLELRLAEALGEAGRVEEALEHARHGFMTTRDVYPEDTLAVAASTHLLARLEAAAHEHAASERFAEAARLYESLGDVSAARTVLDERERLLAARE